MGSSERQVSVVVTPRERFSTTPRTLERLFETVPDDIPMIVVDGGAPRSVLDGIETLRKQRDFKLITSPHVVLPSEARNIGYRATDTEFVVFVDNDVIVEDGWLEAMLDGAVGHSADVVTPLICVGPPIGETIHHAGGLLKAWHHEKGIVLNETNRLMDQPFSEFDEAAAPVYAEVCEFHTVLIRRSLIDRMGGFAEGLNTREHLDFCMRCAVLGARVVFERRAVVTYLREADFSAGDLPYHLYRWSNKVTNRSIRNFETTWNVLVPKRHLRVDWIGNHRRRAIEQAYPRLKRFLGDWLFDLLVARRLEKSIVRREEKRRKNREPNRPAAFDREKADAIVRKVLDRPDPFVPDAQTRLAHGFHA